MCRLQRDRRALCNAQSRHSLGQSHAGARSIFGPLDPWRVDASIAAQKYAMGGHVVDHCCGSSFCLLPGSIISITRREAAVPADERARRIVGVPNGFTRLLVREMVNLRERDLRGACYSLPRDARYTPEWHDCRDSQWQVALERIYSWKISMAIRISGLVELLAHRSRRTRTL